MESQSLIILSLLASFVALSIGLAGLWGLRSRFLANFGLGGWALYAALTFLILAVPLLWIVSLLPSWDFLEAPRITGIGGNPYGLAYDRYLYTIGVLFVHWISITCILCFCSTREVRPLRLRWEVDALAGQLRSFLERYPAVEYSLFFACLILSVLNFTVIGWDRIWLSPLGRFENEQSLGLLSVLLNVKTIFPLIMAGGVASAGIVGVGVRPLLGAVSCFLCALPFLAVSSRGFSLLMVMLFTALIFRFRGRARIVLVVIYPIIGFFALNIPLVQRGLGYTGVATVIPAVSGIVGNSTEISVVSRASGLLANLSQGFPVLVEVLDLKAGDADGMKRVPAGYLLLSSLPTVSFIDGFSEKYKPFNPRINRFTPYSSIAELAAVNTALSIAFFTVYFGILFALLKVLAKMRPLGAFVGVVVAFVGMMAVVQMQQYGVRTFTRFYFLAILLGVLALIVLPYANRRAFQILGRREEKVAQ